MPDQNSQAFMDAAAKIMKERGKAFPDDNNISPPACYKQCVDAGYKSPNDKVANIADANQY